MQDTKSSKTTIAKLIKGISGYLITHLSVGFIRFYFERNLWRFLISDGTRRFPNEDIERKLHC